MKVKLSPELKCIKCKHKWIPRKRDVRQCPRCKTSYWEGK